MKENEFLKQQWNASTLITDYYISHVRCNTGQETGINMKIDTNSSIYLPERSTNCDRDVLIRSRKKRRNGIQIENGVELKRVLVNFLSLKYTMQMGIIM